MHAHRTRIHHTDGAGGVAEGREVDGARFAYPAGGQHRSVEHHQHAVCARGQITGDGHRVAEVTRAVGVGDVGRALSPGQHDGPGVGVDEVEQDGGLFEGVSAMGDHHTVNVVAVKLAADLHGHGTHIGQRHPVGADAQYIMRLHREPVAELETGEQYQRFDHRDDGPRGAPRRMVPPVARTTT